MGFVQVVNDTQRVMQPCSQDLSLGAKGEVLGTKLRIMALDKFLSLPKY